MRLLKILLIWMIVLAIPAQGMAAATMLLCGPSHHRMQASLEVAEPHANEELSEPQHEHGQQAPHHHDEPSVRGSSSGSTDSSHHGHGPSQASPAADAADHAGKLTELGKYKCSACASCCSAAAMLCAFPALAAVATASEPLASPVVSVTTFITGGPDRPPRPLLA